RAVVARPATIHQSANTRASAESFSPIADRHCRKPGSSEMLDPSVSLPKNAAQRHSRIVHRRETKRVGGVVFAQRNLVYPGLPIGPGEVGRGSRPGKGRHIFTRRRTREALFFQDNWRSRQRLHTQTLRSVWRAKTAPDQTSRN